MDMSIGEQRFSDPEDNEIVYTGMTSDEFDARYQGIDFRESLGESEDDLAVERKLPRCYICKRQAFSESIFFNGSTQTLEKTELIVSAFSSEEKMPDGSIQKKTYPLCSECFGLLEAIDRLRE